MVYTYASFVLLVYFHAIFISSYSRIKLVGYKYNKTKQATELDFYASLEVRVNSPLKSPPPKYEERIRSVKNTPFALDPHINNCNSNNSGYISDNNYNNNNSSPAFNSSPTKKNKREADDNNISPLKHQGVNL